jgi:hypothetical protein
MEGLYEILTSDNFKKRVTSHLNFNLDRMIVITFSVSGNKKLFLHLCLAELG